jgi:signal transduction histidine kinase
MERTSILEERNRVSREIHDTIGHRLTTLMMLIEASQDLVETDSASARKLLQTASEHAQDALWQTRRAVRAMRFVGRFDLSGLRGIKRMVDAFAQATGVEVTTDYGNLSWGFDPPHHGTVVAIIQEGLTNAFRHGKATHIRVMFWLTDKTLRVSLLDNGTGSTVIEEGIGLTGMHERLGLIGGTMETRSMSSGFALSAWIPLE